MKRKEFGKLLAALRKSRRDEFIHPITQQQLAELAGISEQMLGNIERGDKVILEPELLLELSKVLGLSTRERREFLLSAIGIDENESPATQPDANHVFGELFDSLTQIALPAFIVDSYDDIVAANNIIISLFNFSEELITIAPTIPGGYNVIRFVFSNQSQFNSLLGMQSEKYLIQCIRFFNAISLPNRADSYYQFLLKSFQVDRKMALFNKYFQREMLDDLQNDYYFEGERFCINHAELGRLDFYSPHLEPVSTNKGNLYLVVYLPASLFTIEACALLASQSRPGARKLAPWPEKRF